MDNDNVISHLNSLIETCRDGQNGFLEAAENVKNPQLKEFFLQTSQERARCVGDLQQEVQRLGGDPENTGSTAAVIHRVWMDIKGTLTGQDDQSILNEVERGEDSAVSAFKSALEADLPANIRSVVESHYQQVKQAHDRAKQLRDSKSVSSSR